MLTLVPAWIRVLVCSGPRQVVNALTLYSVYNVKLQINGDTFETSLLNFFGKIKALASEDYRQALILSGMLFTLVVWVFSFLFLAAGALCFVFFLWYYIPRADGGLSAYCERKANKRLMQIVSKKINKAMAEDERKRKKAEVKAAKKKGGDRPISMRATLPNVGLDTGDKFSGMPSLHRNETMTTLPPYTSRPGTPSGIELNSMDQRRPLPPRMATNTTTASSVGQFSSHQPLLGAAAGFGVTGTASRAPSLPQLDMNFRPPSRPGTTASAGSYGGPAQLNRAPTNASSASSASQMRSPMEGMPPLPSPVRSPMHAPSGYRGAASSGNGRPSGDEHANGRASPALSVNPYRRGPQSPSGFGPNGYTRRSATNPLPPRGTEPHAPQRSRTGPLQPSYQPSDSGSSLRPRRASPPQYYPPQDRGEYLGRPDDNRPDDNRPGTANSQRPGTANSQRPPPPQGGYGARGWEEARERGPRY